MVRQFTEAEVRRWRPAGLVIFSLTLAVLGHSGWLRGQTEEAAKPLAAPSLSAAEKPQSAADRPAPAETVKPAPPSLPESVPPAIPTEKETEKSQPAEEPAARPEPAAPEATEPAARDEAAENSSAPQVAPSPREAEEAHPVSSIVITPRQKYPRHAPYAVAAAGGSDAEFADATDRAPSCSCEVPGSCPQCRPQIRAADYRRAYESIPYSRAEYDANPSYRHEAAMELLFGQLRPTTIYKVQPAVPPRSAALSSAAQLLQPAPFRHYRFGHYRQGYGVYYRWPSWQLR